MNKETGLYVLAIGGVIVLAGVVIYFFHDKLGWIGRLPGDIRIDRPGFRMYIPITTMILASALLSVAVYVIRRFF